MLERNQFGPADVQRFYPTERDRDFIKFADIKLFLRRYAPFIGSFAAAGAALGLFYIVTSDPIYTARTQILIEPKIPQLLQQQASEINLSLDTSQVETQLAVLRSEKIANMVIDELELIDHPKFTSQEGASFSERIDKLLVLLGLSDGLATSSPKPDVPTTGDGSLSLDPEYEARQQAVWDFGDNLSVARAGVSYAIDIWFQARDPELAAEIANATAEAFVREQLEIRTAAASEGLRWLEARIEEVRAQMNQATKDAQEFRARHDFSIGEGEQESGPTLEELEVTADTYRKMYESLLEAFTSSVNQQPYLIADARVISAATRPLHQSHPRKMLTLAFSVVAGLMLGFGLAIARQLTDRSLRNSRQIRDELGLEPVGELPVVHFRRGGFGRFLEAQRRPRSTFARSLREAARTIAMSDPSGSVRLVGIISARPTDGKSTIASNLAALDAQFGKRTLLVDADAQKAVLTRSFSRATEAQAEARGFAFLPSTSEQVEALLGGKAEALADLAEYESVIVDLPPLTSDISFREAAGLLDAVVLVAEWGKTPVEMLSELVAELRTAKVSMPGVIMTKVRSLSSLRYRRRLMWWAR